MRQIRECDDFVTNWPLVSTEVVGDHDLPTYTGEPRIVTPIGRAGRKASLGDCYDNSIMESLWGTLQLEVLDTRT
jgi:hypothetical protein